jgi:hypothetical protein
VLPVIEIGRARSLSVVKSLWKRLRTDYNMNVFILVLTQRFSYTDAKIRRILCQILSGLLVICYTLLIGFVQIQYVILSVAILGNLLSLPISIQGKVKFT